MRQIAISLLVLLSISCAARAVAGEAVAPEKKQLVTLGRPLKARPWISDTESLPKGKVDYDKLPVSRLIPREGAHYRIDPEVDVVAYTYFFHVEGIDADYVVGSAINLVKLIHELEVVEELKQRHKGKEFATGVADGVKGIGTGVANLVTHPGQSFKSLGNKLRQTGRSLERVVGAEEKVGVDEGGTDRSYLGSGPAGQARRAIAFQVGVDVYTANPVLQKQLTDLSHVYTAGGIATWVIPYNIGMLNYFNPLSGDAEVEARIRDLDPYELRRQVGEDLGPVLGMSREDKFQPLNKWLMNPNYSPRNVAYVGSALRQLREAGNLASVMNELATASTPEEAEMMTLELQLFALLNNNEQPIIDFAKYGPMFAGLGANNIVYIIFPGDTLRPWSEPRAAFRKIAEDVQSKQLAGIQILAVGDVHPKLVEGAAQFGATIRQNILEEPTFSSQPAQ